MRSIGKFIGHFREQGLAAHQIAGDAGGLGGPVLDRLAESGWRIRRVHNGSPARKPEHFANLAAEVWFEARGMIERKQIILPADDRELVGQLTGRKGWADSRGRLTLESKQDMRNRGLPSPDRADAVLGAMMLGQHGSQGATTVRKFSRFERMGSNGHFADSDHPFERRRRSTENRKLAF